MIIAFMRIMWYAISGMYRPYLMAHNRIRVIGPTVLEASKVIELRDKNLHETSKQREKRLEDNCCYKIDSRQLPVTLSGLVKSP